MPTSITALGIFLVLVPGFLTLWIQESLGEKKDRTQLERLFIIFLYDIFIFGIYLVFLGLFPKFVPIIFTFGEKGVNIIGISFWNVIVFLTISTILGIMFAMFNVHGWHYKILGKLRISYSTGRISVWNDILYEYLNYYVIVHLEEGIRIFGWLSDFSLDPRDKHIFVKDAKYLGSTSKEDVEIKGPGILITSESKIKLIEFLNPEEGESE